ncbi:hypothetical protein BDV29DRAFT_186805 [Aspergillus leporis]|uniref:Uncharacterized protein n=1 Tax=Aspergillus leporis TaxID=41062 RepID=A0A5N5WIX4_9EURO|nr:hypothetical protein BDV29DRAFT_186805 [Aspergillus leporis]
MAAYLLIITLLALANCHALAAAAPAPEFYENGLSGRADNAAVSDVADESPTRLVIRYDTEPSTPTVFPNGPADNSKYYEASDEVRDPETPTDTDELRLFTDMLSAGDDRGELDMLSEPVTITRRQSPRQCASAVRSTIDSCKRKVKDDVSTCKQKQKDAIASCKEDAKNKIDKCKKDVGDRVNQCKEDIKRQIDECKRGTKNPFKKAACEKRRINIPKCELQRRPGTATCEARRPGLMAGCEIGRLNVPKCEFERCRTPCCEATRLAQRVCQLRLPIPRVQSQVAAFQQTCMATNCKGL